MRAKEAENTQLLISQGIKCDEATDRLSMSLETETKHHNNNNNDEKKTLVESSFAW